MKTAEFVIGLGVAALGVFIAVETSQITVSPAYAKVGPGVIPDLVAGGLILLGLAFAAQAWRSAAPTPAPAPTETSDWRALVVASIGLIVQMLLLETAGFVIASAVLFGCVAYGFGSRRYLRDALVALLLAVVVYVGFTRALHLQLPAGLLKGIL